MKNTKYTKEFLSNAVKGVNSYRQLIISLGMRYPAGGTQVRLRKYIEEYGIDVSHFHGQGWNKGGHVKPPHTKESFTEQILCINGKGWGGTNIKRKILEFKLKDHKCEACQNTEWLSLPIPLEIHHVNGNKNDNRLENLRLLCPNCHSLTDNYRGKNIGKAPVAQ